MFDLSTANALNLVKFQKIVIWQRVYGTKLFAIGKLLVISNFSFSYNVIKMFSKASLLMIDKNEIVW